MNARHRINNELTTHMEIELNTEIASAVRFSARQALRWPAYDLTEVEVNHHIERTILSEVRVLRTTAHPRRDT